MTDPYLQVQHVKNMLIAAAESGTVKQFILSTVICANLHPKWVRERGDKYLSRAYYESKFLCEEVLREKGEGFDWMIVRPGWYSNTHYILPECEKHFPGLAKERVLRVSYGPDDKLGHIDVRDIGLVVAGAMCNPEAWKLKGREIDLVAENLGIMDVARVLEDVSGVKVKVVFRSEEEDESLRREMVEGRYSVPGVVHQWAMKELPGVFELEVTDLEMLGMKLGGLKDTFGEGTEERRRLHEMWRLDDKTR